MKYVCWNVEAFNDQENTWYSYDICPLLQALRYRGNDYGLYAVPLSSYVWEKDQCAKIGTTVALSESSGLYILGKCKEKRPHYQFRLVKREVSVSEEVVDDNQDSDRGTKLPPV